MSNYTQQDLFEKVFQAVGRLGEAEVLDDLCKAMEPGEFEKNLRYVSRVRGLGLFGVSGEEDGSEEDDEEPFWGCSICGKEHCDD